MRRSRCFPACRCFLNEDGCEPRRTCWSEFSAGQDEDKDRGVVKSRAELEDWRDSAVVQTHYSGGFMECSGALQSLCRLSAETGRRSKWSLVATDFPASICAGDQSSFFPLSLLFVLPLSSPCFSGRDQTVDDDCWTAPLGEWKTAFCVVSGDEEKIWITRKGAENEHILQLHISNIPTQTKCSILFVL